MMRAVRSKVRVISPIGRQTVATPGALAALAAVNVTPGEILIRLARCDWGHTCKGDARQNDRAIVPAKEGGGMTDRVLAVYKYEGATVWAITEHDLSVTTILLPEDY